MKITPKTRKIFFFISNFFLILILSIFYYLLLPLKNNTVVFIPQGSVGQIITYLNNNHYPMSKIDKYILFLLGHPQSGWINLGTKPLNKIEFLHKLTVAKAALETITLIPGETTVIFLEQLAKQLNLNQEKLLAEYKKQAQFEEGMLYPETYKIPKGITEPLLIYFLLKHSENTYKKIALHYLKLDNINNKKWREIIIAASVVQKEAANNDEMQMVASVIYNRLRKGMKLQMDGTLNYGIYSHIKVTPERIRKDTTPYNTYKFDGFPKEAVCNVSLHAIRAVISEKRFYEQNKKGSSNYLYFMRDKKSGKHIFTTNLNDHNKVIERQK